RVIGREPTTSGEAHEYYLSVDLARIQTMAEVFWKTGLEFTLQDCFWYFSDENCREKAFDLAKDEKLKEAAKGEFERNPDVSSIVSAIRPWTTGTLGALLNTYSPQITLENVFSGRQLAYFAIPLGHLQVMANPLGRMLISGLLSIAAGRQQTQPKPGPASIILDEFAEFATPAFASFIATVGSARLWTVLSHQDLGQLKKVAGVKPEAFVSAVFNNTSGGKVCFRTPDPEDAEFWSRTMGTYSTVEDTERVQKGFFRDKRTGEMSRRTVERFKIHPNKLKDLSSGTAFVFTPGGQPCLARTARVYPILGGRSADLPFVEGLARPGLDLASAAKPKFRPDAAVNADGVAK
ncbi:MAG: TraM recognition domain-containing protein, partial [Elusimicrobia bacterium]|nr:TraM recognition domain-containing protein [Elusimicrobiota bacterium]